MDVIPQFTKPAEVTLDYSWDWTAWLGADTISGFNVTADSPLALVSQMRVGNVVTAFIRGGSTGSVRTATCQITTTGGRIEQRQITLSITPR